MKILKLAIHSAWLLTCLVPCITLAQPHVGVWTTIDPNDGSRGYIGVNAALQIVFFDSDATFGCAEGGGGPFLGIDQNNGNTVRLEDHVLVGFIDGMCQNGGKNKNTSFDFGMGHFPEFDQIRSRGTLWSRTYLDPEVFVEQAFELVKLSPYGWDFFKLALNWDYLGSVAEANPLIIPGKDCGPAPHPANADLRACDLAFQDLGFIGDSILREANLYNARLESGIYVSDLSGTNLMGASIFGDVFQVNFRYADLRMAKLAGIFFQPVFWGANLDGAEVIASATYFNDADFRRASLRHANFWRLELRRPDFRHADLRGATFGLVVDALFGNTTCPDGSNSDDHGGYCDL